jgi:hypothetical protein
MYIRFISQREADHSDPFSLIRLYYEHPRTRHFGERRGRLQGEIMCYAHSTRRRKSGLQLVLLSSGPEPVFESTLYDSLQSPETSIQFASVRH